MTTPIDRTDELAKRFEAHRPRLRAVAYRMLGSLSEADDAVQEAWLRLSRADAGAIENLGGWLTTVVARVCLDMLRTRASRREEPLDARDAGADRRTEPTAATRSTRRCSADSVGLALLVVLDDARPGRAAGVRAARHVRRAVRRDRADRRAGRRPRPRQLASRARRRVQGARAVPDPDLRAASAASSTRSSPPRARATSTRWSPCSTPTWCCAPTAGPAAAARPACAAPRTWRAGAVLRRAALTGSAAGAGQRRRRRAGRCATGSCSPCSASRSHDGRIVAIDVLADPERLAALDVSRVA